MIPVFVAVGAVVLLVAGGIAGVWTSRKMRDLVADQFNQEQLVIAGHVSALLENTLEALRRELLLLKKARGAHGTFQADRAAVDAAFSRVLERGVWKIEVVDLKEGRTVGFMPYQPGADAPLDEARRLELAGLGDLGPDGVWTSKPGGKPHRSSLYLAVPLVKGPGRFLLFHVNLSWLLAPVFREIRSGKTGYAWLIDQEGRFLFHPNKEFIGQSAMEVRGETFPDLSFRRINYIQKEEMIKGLSGTGWYHSGWHRGITGMIKKLIAYSPVTVATHPPQRWSVAVVAPIAEIEEALEKGNFTLLVVQSLVFFIILLGSGTILFFEMRWSRILEARAEKRTAELKKSEEKYRSLVESAEDFIFSVDLEGCFLSMNSFTASFFGGIQEEFLGKKIETVFLPEVAGKQMELIRVVGDCGKSVRDEFGWEMGDRPIWLNANFMPLKGEDGRVQAVLCIARDITESKLLEKQLVNTEKLASMGTLAAGVAHEINNPLGVILGFCDLLLRSAEPGSQACEDLKTIERQGLHCKDVVENLLSFARQGEGRSEYCDLRTCLEHVLHVVGHTLEMRNIDLSLDIDREFPPVRGDSRQLQQVFLNLITNAISAMEKGGTLSIGAFLNRKTRKVCLEFKDTGTGIRPEHMEHIFEPFFTTKPEGEGTGLGLFVSYGIISAFGGSIDCSSRLEEPSRPGGTTFRVNLLTRRGEH